MTSNGTAADVMWRRRCFAREIETIAQLTTAHLIDALATIPRERFLPGGPWLVADDSNRDDNVFLTPDDNPCHLYHNRAVAIDPARSLFNGPPGLVARCIDALALRRGSRVLHVGAGRGYYSAIIAHVIGASGRLVAEEVDVDMAAIAAANLGEYPWVDVNRHDRPRSLPAGTFDAIFVNAGVTHPQSSWLDALTVGGRLVLPLTVTNGVPATVGHGLFTLLIKKSVCEFTARTLAGVTVYSGVGLRDPAMNERLANAFQRSPLPKLSVFSRGVQCGRRECWVHGPDFCLT